MREGKKFYLQNSINVQKKKEKREILKEKYERKFFGKLENENNLPMNHGQSKRNEVEGEFELSFS